MTMTELRSLKAIVLNMPIENIHANHYVKECLETLINELINDDENYAEQIILSYFEVLEETGWYLNDSEKILAIWYKLGHIVGIKDIEEKLNTLKSNITNDLKIKHLEDLQKNKEINNEMPNTPLFYNKMKQLMDKSIDNVVQQLNYSNKIDEMLHVFDKDIDKFLNLSTEDYYFTDSEDRETIGELYMQIKDIIGMKYSRGLLRNKLGLF